MWLLLLAPALALAPDTAEYNRLTQELERLSARNAWVGVERTFRELVATGVPPSYDDWYRGAQSARALGDIAGAYERAKNAARIQGEHAIVDWLASIDAQFGKAFLACDEGSHITLRTDALPFDPDQRRAIEFAQAEIRERCLFEGRLPAGTYDFFGQELEVMPRVQEVRVDLRGVEIDRKTKKALRKQWSSDVG